MMYFWHHRKTTFQHSTSLFCNINCNFIKLYCNHTGEDPSAQSSINSIPTIGDNMYWGKNTVDDHLLTEKISLVYALLYKQVMNKLKVQKREIPEAGSVETLEYKCLVLQC